MIVHNLPRGRIHEGDWLLADLAPGYDLAIVDGPYAMGIAAWDRMKIDDLAAWYEPHIARLTSLMAPSASVYLWNTAAGWARLDPVMRAAGWTFRALVTWQKTNPPSQKGCEDLRAWPDVTEVCGFYQREEWETTAAATVADAASRDDRNWIRDWLISEWRDAAGLGGRPEELRADGNPWRSHADRALGTNGIGGHYFNTALWSLPTWDKYQRLAAYAAEYGPARARPYLVHPSVWPDGGLRASYDHLRASYDHLRSEYDHLRAEYEATRAPFTLPPGVTNVWSAPLVGGAERLKGPDGTALHPCQKPLAFAERMIRASSRPGSRVLVPFGGTCREAVVCEWMARVEPDEARSYDVCEINADGRDYIGPVLAQIRGEDTRARAPGQVSLFAGSAA